MKPIQSTAGLLLALLVSTVWGDHPGLRGPSNAPSRTELPEPFNPTRKPARQNSVEIERLMASRLKWEQLRKAHGGNYSYTVRWSSAFGFGHLTTIIVRENRVVERRYEEFNRSAAPSAGGTAVGPMPKWVETGSQVGTHGQEGAPARTVDELYAAAARLVSEQVPESHQLSLGITPAGLLHHCTVVDRRLMDDAPLRGVPAFDLQWAPSP
jgi:hypothetical protein